MRNETQETYQLLCDLLADRSREEDWAALSHSDWIVLTRVAQAEGVVPLVYWHFNHCGWSGSAPKPVQDMLRYTYAASFLRNRSLFQELDRILDALARAGVPVILLKGADLAASVYPDMGLRPMSDLDLLLPKSDVANAVQAMHSLGYADFREERTRGLDWRTAYDRKLVGGARERVAVELHWNLVAGDAVRHSPSIDWFWQQTEAVAPGSEDWPGLKKALRLTPTAHLLYLTAHLMLQHGGAQARLLWYYDLHLLLERSKDRIQWDEFLERSRQFRWASAAHAALAGAHADLDTPLPPGLLQALAETPDPQASSLVSRRGASQTTTARAWDKLGSLDWRARWLFAWGMFFPRPAYLRQRYAIRPAWLWPLYYPYRWLDMLRDGFRTVLRASQRARSTVVDERARRE